MDVLVEPAHEILGDSGAVLFGHELVTVARQPHRLKPNERRLHSGQPGPLEGSAESKLERARTGREQSSR